jgi:hypothetical protein
MSTLAKAVLGRTVISLTTVAGPNRKAEPYRRPQPAISDAVLNSGYSEKNLTSSLLIPVLGRSVATH